jgi:putative sterol carrier protein
MGPAHGILRPIRRTRREEDPVVVRFLSEEWAGELRDRLRASAEFSTAIAGKSVRILQKIDTTDGAVDYWLTIEDGSIDLGLGSVDAPDATISQDYATAVGLANSELSPVTAFMTGKIKIAGNLMSLMGLQEALSVLPGVMADMDIEY